jgi:Trk K+ transport system NAD-binding subunit
VNIQLVRSGHVLVCGFSVMARTALAELVTAGRSIGLLCENPKQAEEARTIYGRGRVTIAYGDPTQEMLRRELDGENAEAAIIAFGEDAKNLVAALNVNAVNPKARVVVALQREELRQTLQAGRVTYIASPSELSGRLVASAAFEPEVAMLLEDLISGELGEVDMQQYLAGDLGGRTVGRMREELVAIDGPLLVALAKPRDNTYKILANPKADVMIERADHIILITNEPQAKRFREKYRLEQGR